MSIPQNPLAPTFDVIATNDAGRDPAIDMADPPVDPTTPPEQRPKSAKQMLATYRRTRDRADLRLRDAVPPTVFKCRRLPATVVASMLDRPDIAERVRQLRAFLLGCHEVQLPGGKTLTPTGEMVALPGGAAMAPDEWADAQLEHAPLDTVFEVGEVIYQASKLSRAAKGPFVYAAGGGAGQ